MEYREQYISLMIGAVLLIALAIGGQMYSDKHKTHDQICVPKVPSQIYIPLNATDPVVITFSSTNREDMQIVNEIAKYRNSRYQQVGGKR